MASELNVLHLTRVFPEQKTGGIEQSIAILADVQTSTEHRVLCLTNENTHQNRVNNLSVTRTACAGSLKFFPVSVGWFREFFKQAKQVDLIHIHSPFPLGELTCLLTRKPVVCSYHADVEGYGVAGRLYRLALKRWLRRPNAIIVGSQQYADSSQVLKLMKKRCTVIPYGIATAAPHPESPEIPLPDRFFLFLGSLRRYKGLEVLLQAHQRTGYPVVIGGDGECSDLLQNAAEGVIWLGSVSEAEKQWLLKRCATLILPSTSRAESFGLVLLEAMRASKPAVTTAIGTATDWIVEHQKTGLVVFPNDPGALANVMTELWCHEEKSKRMGLEAQERFKDQFTDSQFGIRVAQLYNKVKLTH